MNKNKIIIAMSGGVDSTVAAHLLKSEGYEVIGVTLKLLPMENSGFGCCGNPEDMALAKRCAEKLGIPHYTLDYTEDFNSHVVEYFVDSYLQGETPNPCLACNRSIKFDKLLRFTASLNATHLSTGHYARIVHDEKTGKVRLFESVDLSKDQSYVLYNLTQKSLSTIFFPLGSLEKMKIRDIARSLHLPNADKKDSQEICFVPNRDYHRFIEEKGTSEGKKRPETLSVGPVHDQSGRVIGEHNGVAYYTVGQRSGLSIKSNIPMYVTRLEAATNTVVVGRDEENRFKGLIAKDITWVKGLPPNSEFSALVKIRYKTDPMPATVKVLGDSFEAIFKKPQKGVSPGQAAVIYQWDEDMGAREVIGGGKIEKSIN